MPKSLENREDIEQSVKATESSDRNIIRIPENKTPFYILDVEYEDGFVHYVQLPRSQRKQRVVCGGGPDGGGFDPDNCPVCKYVLSRYEEAKKLREKGKQKKGDEIKNEANDMRGKYEAHFKAVRGTRVRLEKPDSKGRRYGAAFDFDEGVDNPAVVGILSLSHAQYTQIADFIRDNEEYPFINKGADLQSHIIWSERKKSGATQRVSFSIDPEESDPPEINQETLDSLDVSEGLQPDSNNQTELRKIYNILTGNTEDSEEEESEEEEDDDEVEMEEPSNEDLDEDEDESEDEDEETEEEDEEEEEEFEDDIPEYESEKGDDLDDVEDDKEADKKTGYKSPAKKKSSTKKSSSKTSKSPKSSKSKGKKSGRAEL